MTLLYDKRGDVLYVTFGRLPRQKYIYVENKNGDVLRLDKKTRHVVGCTITAFSKRAGIKRLNVPEVGLVPFNGLAEQLAF